MNLIQLFKYHFLGICPIHNRKLESRGYYVGEKLYCPECEK